jgi:DNA polymerase III subunit epsilon
LTARLRPTPLLPRLSAAEREAHCAFVQTLGDGAIWLDYLAPPAATPVAVANG